MDAEQTIAEIERPRAHSGVSRGDQRWEARAICGFRQRAEEAVWHSVLSTRAGSALVIRGPHQRTGSLLSLCPGLVDADCRVGR
jgi:hypothetical protein